MTAGKGKLIEKSHKASDPSAPARKSARQAGVDFSSQRDFTASSAAQIAGNLAVQHLFRAGAIQAKLSISHPQDPGEQEADRVADQVMRMAEPGPINSAPSVLHRKCATCKAGDTTCATCDEEEKVRRKESRGSPSGREKGPLSFPSTAAPGGLTSAPPIVHEVLGSSGQPLGTTERAFMEPRFGQDFSGVRVHTGAKAAESAAAVQARAYTVGNNIVFGGNESASDLPVLAHELTHVVQQNGASPALQRLEYCEEFLENTRRPGITENPVRDSLAVEAAPLGTVEKEFCIPGGSFDPYRPQGQDIDTIIRTLPKQCLQGDGKADIAVLSSRTLQIIEVKEATWDTDTGAPAAEIQLRNYLDKADPNPELVTDLWRERGHTADTITRFEGMPVTRLNLLPNPRLINGVWVELSWCADGIIVFRPYEEEEEEEPEEPEDEEPKDTEPDPGESIPEQLAELGAELFSKLAKAKLLDIAFALGRGMGAFLASPFVALAAVVVGIVYFWDEIKAIASKIAAVAQAVWDKIAALADWVKDATAWVQERLHDLAVKLTELGSFLAEKIGQLVAKLIDGVEWVAGRIWEGGKWLGGKIASGAEAFWDWLWDSDFEWPWGSDVEPMIPNVDIPLTYEPERHCRTVAQVDTIVKLPADLLFPFKEFELKKEADGPLGEAAEKIIPLLQKDEDRVYIGGYTDIIGSDEYNQRLSEQRAEAVKSWFVKDGRVPASKIGTKGYGKTQAKAKADDEDGRKQDRRVEIWVPKHGGVEEVCW